MNLSDEEVELVLQFRKAREAELERKKDKLFILKTAYEYEKFLQERGVESTYSNFLNAFGYADVHAGDFEKWMFDAVNYILEIADSESRTTNWKS